jgi:diaminohydroxyphosphoribosylaminopyrimidine deaminase/5-amino-6-(5-phosphoribosylamino)uracil reductase
VLAIVCQDADPDRVVGLKSAGAEIVVADGIDAALSDLGRRGITSLFLEGGRTLAAAFAAAGQIDEARVFVALILLAGNERLNALDPNADDTLITTRFKEW